MDLSITLESGICAASCFAHASIEEARGFYQAKWAVVVSNRTYTPSARELAQSLGVVLVHHDELVSLHEVLEG
jgi:HJR/Mrr/RecB family endonuclease